MFSGDNMSLLQQMYEEVSSKEKKVYTDFSKELKQWLKKNFGGYSWSAQISGSITTDPYIRIFNNQGGVPNELRKLIIKKVRPNANIRNWDDIDFGAVEKSGVTLLYSEWKEVLE